MPGFYPTREADQVVWWATFNQECIDHSATFAAILDAPTLTKIAAIKVFVGTLVNATDDAKNFAKQVAEYKNIWLDSPLGTSAPSVPVPPAAIVPGLNLVVGIEAYARLLAGQLNAHPAMDDAIRAAMGIKGSTDSLGTVRIVSAEAQGGSAVQLRIGLAGYAAVAVYRKRNNVVENIGTSLTSTFVDSAGPLAGGQSESREYWVRGIVNNVEVGDISASVFVATTP
ncbi:MAG: hypothetical protein U0R49_03380 [Fimbriimonadales bacterium]